VYTLFVIILFFVYFFFFFFSSRRRHTRSKRDWSSDVCSSDLHPDGSTLRFDGDGAAIGVTLCSSRIVRVELVDDGRSGPSHVVRSEERRVGKECRSRWWAEQ